MADPPGSRGGPPGDIKQNSFSILGAARRELDSAREPPQDQLPPQLDGNGDEPPRHSYSHHYSSQGRGGGHSHRGQRGGRSYHHQSSYTHDRNRDFERDRSRDRDRDRDQDQGGYGRVSHRDRYYDDRQTYHDRDYRDRRGEYQHRDRGYDDRDTRGRRRDDSYRDPPHLEYEDRRDTSYRRRTPSPPITDQTRRREDYRQRSMSPVRRRRSTQEEEAPRRRRRSDQEETPPSNEIKLDNLPRKIVENELKEQLHLSCQVDVTDVLDVRIIRDKTTGESRGFGFVTFSSVQVATKLIEEFPWFYVSDEDGHSEKAVPHYSHSKSHTEKNASDWTCPNCAETNFGTRQSCRTCSQLRPDAEEVTTTNPIAEAVAYRGEGDKDEKPSDILMFRNLPGHVNESELANAASRLFKDPNRNLQQEAIDRGTSMVSTSEYMAEGARANCIRRVFIAKSKYTRNSLGYGFVEFETVRDASAAMRRYGAMMPRFSIGTQQIEVHYIHSGVFIPIALAKGYANDAYSFPSIINPTLKLCYWHQQIHVTYLDIPTFEPQHPQNPQQSQQSQQSQLSHQSLQRPHEDAHHRPAQVGTMPKGIKKPKLSGSGSLERPSLEHLAPIKRWEASQESLRRTEGRQLPKLDRVELSQVVTHEWSEADLEAFVLRRQWRPAQQGEWDKDHLFGGMSRLPQPTYRSEGGEECLLCQFSSNKQAVLRRHELSNTGEHRANEKDGARLRSCLEELKARGLFNAAHLWQTTFDESTGHGIGNTEDDEGIDTPLRGKSRPVFFDRAQVRRKEEALSAKREKEAARLSKERGGPGESMLRDMGWSSGGLGASQQGRADPIMARAYRAGAGLGADEADQGDAAEVAARNTQQVAAGSDFVERTRENARRRFAEM